MSEKSYSQFNLFIRSLIFSIYSVISIFFFSIAVTLCIPLPLRIRCMVIHAFLKSQIEVLKIVCHINYQVEGLENIPKDRNGIIMSKHQSTWETFYLPLIFNIPAAIGKREILWIPFFGWGFAASEPITINRSNKSSAMQQIIREGKKRLDQGRWIMVFPEGTRVAPGHAGKYKLGGARLSAATGYPIIPVAHNAGLYWPRRKFIKRPGTVRMVIGPLIEPKDHPPEELLEQTKDWIEKTMTRLE